LDIGVCCGGRWGRCNLANDDKGILQSDSVGCIVDCVSACELSPVELIGLAFGRGEMYWGMIAGMSVGDCWKIKRTIPS
jgi:hypothetical protein